MIYSTLTVGQIAARSAARASPWLGGLGALFGAAVHFGSQHQAARDRRSFLREIALDDLFSVEYLIMFRQDKEPIVHALQLIADPKTDNELRTALRKAVAPVL